MEPNRGVILDELVQNPRRLMVVHVCLGLIIALIYWMRPGTFTPSLHRHDFKDVRPIVNTFIAWAPYVVGYLNAKSILSNRAPAAVYFYALIALVVTIIAGALYLDRFHFPESLAPWEVSIGVVLALVTSAFGCGILWKPDTTS